MVLLLGIFGMLVSIGFSCGLSNDNFWVQIIFFDTSKHFPFIFTTPAIKLEAWIIFPSAIILLAANSILI